MASKCPADNSTEAIACLLRQITSNTSPAWNWDPLNFAVTAAIGLLALVIACITVFQGLLAAGPGRLKASTLAIGPFSIHSRSRFDRTEFALRTTARVPLITWDVVYHRVVRQKFRPNFHDPRLHRHHHNINADLNGQAFEDNDHGVSPRPGNALVKQRHQYDSTATWLTLLAALGLDDPQFFPLVQRVTDYLPADIQAAPAAAELRCLAILAVIADTNATIDASGPGNRFFRVSTDSSQLVFREHPSMGTVAAYEAYEETAMLKVGSSAPLQFGRQLVLSFEDLDRCLQLASGRLAYADARIPASIDGQADERSFLRLVRDLAQRSTGCQHDICAHAFQDWRDCMQGIREQKKPWKVVKALNAVYMAVSLLTAERSNMCRGFPKQKLMLQNALKEVVGLDEFWSTGMSWQKTMQLLLLACRTFWTQANVPLEDTISASWVVNFQTVQSTVRNPFLNTPRSLQRQFFKDDKGMHFVQSIREFVTRWTTDLVDVEELEGRSLTSESIVQSLTCLDMWLLKAAGIEASCSMLRLLYKLGVDANLLTVSRETFRDKSLKHVPSTSGVMKTSESDHVDVSALLVLRSILMALMLDSGADTSILYGSEFRNSVVRML